jgi:hypothetical protein
MLAMLITTLQMNAQNGTIRGAVYDAGTGEYLPGVTIFAEGTSAGTITDLDGNFSLGIAPGTYDLRISFISYETVLMENVEVISGDVTLLEDLGMETANISIDEVVMSGETIRNSENALISVK